MQNFHPVFRILSPGTRRSAPPTGRRKRRSITIWIGLTMNLGVNPLLQFGVGETGGRYLRRGFAEKISVIRILDSRRENFKLGKAYENKVDVINVITAPEIEMLIIFNEGKYNKFKKS